MMNCKKCGSSKVIKHGKNNREHNGQIQRYRCKSCEKTFINKRRRAVDGRGRKGFFSYRMGKINMNYENQILLNAVKEMMTVTLSSFDNVVSNYFSQAPSTIKQYIYEDKQFIKNDVVYEMIGDILRYYQQQHLLGLLSQDKFDQKETHWERMVIQYHNEKENCGHIPHLQYDFDITKTPEYEHIVSLVEIFDNPILSDFHEHDNNDLCRPSKEF